MPFLGRPIPVFSRMALKNWKSIIALRLIMLTTASLDHMYYRLREKPSDSDELVIYFGGDIQDFKELMKNDTKKKQYLDWSYDNTSEILSNKFPYSDLLLVAPSRYDNNSFSYYDKYVNSGDMGIPNFTPYHGALIHLNKLMNDLADMRTAWDKGNKTDFTKYRFRIIGFSKGCVVLNQFLYEFHYGPQTTSDPVLQRMISQIDEMYFLDGGHAGTEETWITDETLLETLTKLGIKVYVHVTPYQVCDKRRPWIGEQEELFTNTLRNFGAKIYRKLHFENDPPSLQKHFELLKAF